MPNPTTNGVGFNWATGMTTPVSLLNPTVQPNPTNPASLQGTATTPKLPPMPAPTPVPAAPAPATPAPAPTPNASPTPAPTPPPTGQSFAMAQALSAIQQKLGTNNSLMQQRQLLLRQVYGPPLTEAEKGQLDPTYLPVVNSGDRQQIDAAIRMIGDSVSGTQSGLSNSVQYLTNAYDQDVQRAETQKQQALQNVLQYASQLDDAGKQALSKMYPDLTPLINSMSSGGGKFQKIGVDEAGNDQYGFVNENSGTVQAYDPSLSGKRTERNVNPIASSIAVNSDGTPNLNDPTTANWIQALQANNINFSVENGANFGGNRATLKFNSPQEGLDGAIVLLQNPGTQNAPSAFYWYKNHTGSQELQGIDTPQEFAALPYDDKINIVKGIYSHEQPGGGIFTQKPEAEQGLTNALNSIAPRLPVASQKAAKQTLNQYIKQGDIEGAKQFIVSTAISALPAADQSSTMGTIHAVDALENISSALDAYTALGGKTNIFKGAQETLFQRVGNTSDPQLAKLGNQIAASIIAYRKAVSGVAFSPQEAKAYENLFPSIGNVPELNKAKIDSLKDIFQGTVKSTLSTVLGQKNYDAVIGGETKKTSTTPTGSLTYDDYLSAIGEK